MKSFYLLLAVLLGAHQLPAQTLGDIRASVVKDSNVTNAPLFLSITGEGRVVPFHNGQMLQVGREHIMVGVPDPGNAFTNWAMIKVFVTTEITFDQNGNQLPPLVTIIRSPPLNYTNSPVLKFTLQPINVIYSNDVFTISEYTEWQANFVPGKRPDSDKNWWRR
jgi:hypothetical protein